MKGEMAVGLMTLHLVVELSVMFNCRLDEVLQKFQLVSEERCEEGNRDKCSFMFMCTEKLEAHEVLEIAEFIDKIGEDTEVQFLSDLEMSLPLTIICVDIDTTLCQRRAIKPPFRAYEDTAELLYWPGILTELDTQEEIVNV